MPKKEVVLRVALVGVERGICALSTCLTLVSVMMTSNWETPTEMMLTLSLEILCKFTTLESF